MKNIIKSSISIAISLFLVTSCSSGNPIAPTKGSLTNLSKIPSTTPETEIRKINLSGRVIDSITRKPIENASVLVYTISNDEVIKSIKNGTKIDPTSSIRPSSNSASNESMPTQTSSSPNSDSMPSQMPVTPFSPQVTPLPLQSINPPIQPIYENEEVVQSTISPVTPQNIIKPGAGLKSNIAKPPIPRMSSGTSSIPPSVLASASPTNTSPTTKEDNEISAESLSSALSNLKLNDLQEFNSKTGNDGKFWINKVPESNVILTINAPNYRSLSIFNADISNSSDIVLEPISSKENTASVAGSVISATNNAVDNAVVSPSYVLGESFAIPVTTDSFGGFRVDDLGIGERTFFATVKDSTGKIVSMGDSDFTLNKGNKVNVNTKKLEVKSNTTIKVSPSIMPTQLPKKNLVEPSPIKILAPISSPNKIILPRDLNKKPLIINGKSQEKNPFENEEEIKKTETKKLEVKNIIKGDKNTPVIKIKSVTSYINIKGKITTAESTTLKSINVYVVFKKPNVSQEEVFLTDKQVDGTADNFDLTLPKLEKNFFYHLEFIAMNKKGSYIYHHEYKLSKDTKDLKVTFLPPINIGRTDFIDKDGEKLPVFTWPAVEGTSFYRVSLDKVDRNNVITTVWQGLTPFNTAIYPITTGNSKLNADTTYYWSIESIKENPNASSIDKLPFSKASIASWADSSRSPNMEFKLKVDENSTKIEEIDRKKEGQ
ncbi:MAG: hypothetical protein H7263_07390 [Candidatus Sericytochromatia bacterium]|nr:hypothetical protein [Candidatus Sericytochromatia bacterium]